MSYRNRLKYANFPALFLNCLMLVFPVVLIALVRGWFFASAWRKRPGCPTHFINTKSSKSGWPTHPRVFEGMGGFTGFRIIIRS